MKIKTPILVLAIVLACIVFGISTYLQRKMIHYEATVACLVLTEDISEKEMVSKNQFQVANVPLSLVMTQRYVSSWEEIEGLYAKDNIKAGQIAMKSQFDTKENLLIYEAGVGKEKIALKVKNPENGMSFQLQENAKINVDVTLRNEYADAFLPEKPRITIGDIDNGYTVIRLLEDVKVLGVFTVEGEKFELGEGQTIDTILLPVTQEEAQEMNLLRDIASFNITGGSSFKEVQNEPEEEIKIETEQGENDIPSGEQTEM